MIDDAKKAQQQGHRRFIVFCLFLLVLLVVLVWHLLDLSLFNRHFLLQQSNARILRKVSIPAYRGMMTDRHAEPLAISIPVDTVWINPKQFQATADQLYHLSSLLNIPISSLKSKLSNNTKKGFIYLKRRMPPKVAEKILALKMPGIYTLREYKRYYPEGDIDAHLIGFTNIDDKGQEGLELTFNQWLAGTPGKKEVIKDRLGHVIANVAMLTRPEQGHPLTLSIDQRIQYLAYCDLQKQVQQYHAASGSVVVLDVKTGEILAMVNQPSYNPNHRPNVHDGRFRNRAVTDMYEPGSTIKAFNIALALKSGRYNPETIIDTRPGWMVVDGHTIHDTSDHGVITLTQLLQKSSNVGAAKVLFSLQSEEYWHLLNQFGFGERTRSGFPGETTGILPYFSEWRRSEVATIAFGYGLAVSPLQLAQAYATLANHGVRLPVTLLKENEKPVGVRVLSAKIADELIEMLKTVVNAGGTGLRARVPGYSIAGKTGTAYIAHQGSYDKKKTIASFVGMAPASDPRLVVAVDIRDPKGAHSGGVVSAPVFSEVMSGALRVLRVPPDTV